MFWVEKKMRQIAETAVNPQHSRKTRPQEPVVIQDTVSFHFSSNSLLFSSSTLLLPSIGYFQNKVALGILEDSEKKKN
jgi:hypothetical protein